MKRGNPRLLGIILVIVFALGFYSGIQFQEKRFKKPSAVEGASLLLDSEYLDNLLYMLDQAENYVHVVMFVVKYDPKEKDDPANLILYKLAELAEKGVEVRLVVDDATRRSYPETLEFLKSRGVDVRLDESSRTTTHTKMVIIDGEVLILGSHNWTESALSYNHEASIAIYNATIISEAEHYFEEIYEAGREA